MDIYLLKLSRPSMDYVVWVESIQVTSFECSVYKDIARLCSDSDEYYVNLMIDKDSVYNGMTVERVEPPIVSEVEEMRLI